MSKSAEARTLLAEMEVGYNRPVLRSDLARSWNRRPEIDEAEELDDLRLFVRQSITAMIDQVRPDDVLSQLVGAVNALFGEAEMGTSGLIDAADESFATDVIDTVRVRSVARKAYSRLDSAREEMTVVSRALIWLRRTDDLLESMEKAVRAFVMDPATAAQAFKTLRDRERVVDAELSDLITYRRYVATARAELVRYDDRLHATREEILRALATLTMFKDLGRQDVQVGQKTANPPVNMFATGTNKARSMG